MLLINQEQVCLKIDRNIRQIKICDLILPMLRFLYKQNVSTSSYYKSILIPKDWIVKLYWQLVFFFKTIKFCCELQRAFLVEVGLHWSKFDFTYNNFGSLENSMWSVIQLALTILYTIVRRNMNGHICKKWQTK